MKSRQAGTATSLEGLIKSPCSHGICSSTFRSTKIIESTKALDFYWAMGFTASRIKLGKSQNHPWTPPVLKICSLKRKSSQTWIWLCLILPNQRAWEAAEGWTGKWGGRRFTQLGFRSDSSDAYPGMTSDALIQKACLRFLKASMSMGIHPRDSALWSKTHMLPCHLTNPFKNSLRLLKGPQFVLDSRGMSLPSKMYISRFYFFDRPNPSKYL